MIDKNKIKYSIDMIKAFTQNGASPNLDEYWDIIIDELSQNINDTKKHLNECSKDDIEFISGYFEDIAYNLKEKKFIDILKELENKYPSINIKEQIKLAESSIEN